MSKFIELTKYILVRKDCVKWFEKITMHYKGEPLIYGIQFGLHLKDDCEALYESKEERDKEWERIRRELEEDI